MAPARSPLVSLLVVSLILVLLCLAPGSLGASSSRFTIYTKREIIPSLTSFSLIPYDTANGIPASPVDVSSNGQNASAPGYCNFIKLYGYIIQNTTYVISGKSIQITAQFALTAKTSNLSFVFNVPTPNALRLDFNFNQFNFTSAPVPAPVGNKPFNLPVQSLAIGSLVTATVNGNSMTVPVVLGPSYPGFSATDYACVPTNALTCNTGLAVDISSVIGVANIAVQWALTFTATPTYQGTDFSKV